MRCCVLRMVRAQRGIASLVLLLVKGLVCVLRLLAHFGCLLKNLRVAKNEQLHANNQANKHAYVQVGGWRVCNVDVLVFFGVLLHLVLETNLHRV